MPVLRPFALLLAVALAPACDRSSVAAAAPGTYVDADQLLRRFMHKGNEVELTRSLQPTPEDYAAVFEPDVAADVAAAYAPLWANFTTPVGPHEGETELRLIEATSDDLRSGAELFPDYAPIVDLLKPGFVWRRYKFVQPGATNGTHGDGLVFVNGHFALFPKPWKYISDKPSEATCGRFSDHMIDLMMRNDKSLADPDTKSMLAGMRPQLIDSCTKDGTRRQLKCALAATTMEGLEKCEQAK